VVSTVGLSGFWSSLLLPGMETTDPRIHYDVYNHRWILITDALSLPAYNNSTILVAVSATNDPTGDWNMYTILVDPSGDSWLDFPNVGYNNKWVVVNGNMFPNVGGGTSGASVFVIDYASMMAGTGAPYTRINQPSSFSIAPAQTYDPAEPNMYAVESWLGTSGQLKFWKISGPVSSPVMTAVGFPATTVHWHGSAPGGGADFATEEGTTNKVQTGDDRFTSLVYRNHKLWCAHTVFLPDPGTATRSSIMWWELDTLGNPLQIGMIDDPATPTFFDYSSVAVNDSEDVLIGFGYLNHTLYPSGAYAMHLHTDPADSLRPPYVFRHGQAQYYTTYGGTDRWGDYSGTCVDPRNGMDFWTIQEASNNSGADANWDTWWANYQFCPKPHAPTLSFMGSPCAGDTASFIIDPIAGATSYTWYVAGGGWTGTGSGTSLHATAGTGTGTIVVLAYNSCGEGESATLSVTPNAVPGAPLVSVVTPPCTGVTSAVFTATGSSGFNWSVVGTGWSGTGSSATFTATVGTGTADIICSTSNACGVGIPDTLVIIPGTPVATFSETTHSTLIDTAVSIAFTGTAPAGSLYTWSYSGGVATPGTGPGPQSVYWATGGTKTVTLSINNNGCVGTYSDTVYVKDPTGVAALTSAGNAVSIVPNPNDGVFDILFAAAVNKTVSVRIIDMDGRTVYTTNAGSVTGNKIQVKAGALVPGNYTVSIVADGAAVTQKLTVTR